MFAPISPPARCRGVTLIEVVISIFVLSIGIMGIMALFPTGYRLARTSVERSVGALAARHAQARLYGRINLIKAPSTNTATEPLAGLSEVYRVGTIRAITGINQVQCQVMGNQDPNWTVSLTDYYMVLTSGSAVGRCYRITASGSDTLTCGLTRFNYNPGETQYEPVRAGDHFAIIGNKTGTKSYPTAFLGALSGTDPLDHPADPENNETRTMPVATYGDPDKPKDQWRYSYGCIFSAPTPEMRDTVRVDIFVYSGFPYRAPAGEYSIDKVSSLAIGHFVAYMSAGRAP